VVRAVARGTSWPTEAAVLAGVCSDGASQDGYQRQVHGAAAGDAEFRT